MALFGSLPRPLVVAAALALVCRMEYPQFRTADGYPSWPAIPERRGGRVMSLLFQMERTQWLSADQLWSHQCRQLTELLTHTYRTAPFYRQRLKAAHFNPGKKVTSDLWRNLPILTREDVQEAGTRLRSGAIPKRHGATFTVSTSGSTATPVTVQKTWVSSVYFNAINMRDHLWHRHDL